MVSGSLALLYFFLGFHGRRQGSSPDRGESPVEWGEIAFVRPSVPPKASQPYLRTHQPGLRALQLDPRAYQLVYFESIINRNKMM